MGDVGASPGWRGIGDGEGEVALVWVARDHFEAVRDGAWEGVLAVRKGYGRVFVVGQVRNFGDLSQCSCAAILEVERGGPVGRLVFGDLAGCAGAAEEVVGGRVEGESWRNFSTGFESLELL